MSPRKYLITGTCFIASFAVAETASAAEIKVMSDTPVASALVKIGNVFHRDTGNEVKFVFGLSPAIEKKIADGEAADVIVIQPNFLNNLVNAGKDRRWTIPDHCARRYWGQTAKYSNGA